MLLTIAIPTFNRVSYLSETLDRLIAELPAQFQGQLEILISDNASTDGTEELCRCRVQDNPGIIRYVRYAVNQGFDRNLDFLFANARGTFVLLVGDDDLPLSGALERLWATLQRNQTTPPGLIYCYHELVDGTTGKHFELDEVFFVPDAGHQDDVIRYESGVELLRKLGTTLHAGLTGTVFLRAAWLDSDRDRFIGTNFLHLAVAYQIAARHAVCVDYRPLFMVRQFGEHRWPANGELYFGLLKAGRPLLEEYPEDVVLELRRKNDWAVRRAMVSYRASAPKDRQLVQVIRDSLDKDRFGYWLIDLPLLAIPGKVLSLMRDVGQALRQRNSRQVD